VGRKRYRKINKSGLDLLFSWAGQLYFALTRALVISRDVTAYIRTRTVFPAPPIAWRTVERGSQPPEAVARSRPESVPRPQA
jgi:hypothetical protein